MRLNNAFKIGVVCFAFALALYDGAWAQIPEHDITVGRTINVPGPSGLVYRDDGFWVISWNIGEGTRLRHYSADRDTWGRELGNYAVPEVYLVQGLAWDGKYWWIADNIHPSGDKIKKCELTSTGLNVLKEYIWPGPGSGPVALEWAQGYLWVVDNHTDVIYRTTVNDTSFTSVEAWSSGNISPYGLAWDGTNMWSSCSPAGGGTSGPREIYKHDANGNIIEIWHYPGADGPPPGAYGGCATDIAFVGNRLWYCDYDKNQIIEAIRTPPENWQIVYQTDFSTDPGWITSWPDRYVWDPATGTYCFSHIMYTYSYVPIAYDPTLKYKLEFDINLTQCEWGSYFNLGLWDADMLTKGPTHWHVRYHHVDEGNSACIVYWTNDLYGGGDSPIMPFALNTWYHNKAIYDPTSDMFTLEITRKDDGVLLGTYTLAAVGEFLNIERLGISCTQSTYGDRLQAGCIDNVVLYVVTEPKPPPVYYVDAVNGNDNNNGLSRRTAFATIAKGIDSATNRYKVLVYPGVYREEVDFKGKAITIQGVATKAGIPIIENPGDFAVSFYNGEGPRSILKNFIIKNSFMAIFIAGSSPTLKNLNIIGNKYGIEAYAGSEPDISNCIFWNNSDSDLFGCEARYSFVQQDIEPLPLRGLVAYWSFDENNRNIVPDKSGNGHNGTIYGATWTQGIAGAGLCFDGLNDYVDVLDDGGLSLTDAVTVSAWIWLDPDWLPEGHGGAGAIVCKHNDVEGRGYALRVLKDRRLRALLEGLNFDSQSKLNLARWTHVAFTFDRSNNKVTLYINGNKEGRGTVASGLTSSGCELRIGDQSCYPGGTGTEVFYGVIDDVRIYNRALSAEEIQQLSSGGLTNSPLFADPANSDYHLLSQRGRYWPRADVWVLDKVTSPCIDGGDPYDDTADEPMPNGGLINMGAFGGTPYASMSKWELKGDIDHDGKVNMIDFSIFAEYWLVSSLRAREIDGQLACKHNLSALGKALMIYANDYEDEFPKADQWCDLLLRCEHDYVTKEMFVCPSAEGGPGHYAINPNANGYSSHPYIVLLFETSAGWNQFGGPELLAPENHQGRGCNILFVDGHVEFVESERLDELRWK